MRSLFIALAFLLFAVPAGAGGIRIEGENDKKGCKIYTLCDGNLLAQTCGGSGTERYIRMEGAQIYTAMVTYTTVDAADGWTIELFNVAQGEGYSTQRTALNPTLLSVANGLSFSWAAPMGDVHADRAVVDGADPPTDNDSVTVQIKTCPGSN
jgi:hypothetical protein